MSSERIDHTLETTALVHEAYLRLVDRKQVERWDNSGHFFAAAAEAMRRILVEHARRKLGPRRGGDRARLELDEGVKGAGENFRHAFRCILGAVRLSRRCGVHNW